MIVDAWTFDALLDSFSCFLLMVAFGFPAGHPFGCTYLSVVPLVAR